jgi:hypothetical protein
MGWVLKRKTRPDGSAEEKIRRKIFPAPRGRPSSAARAAKEAAVAAEAAVAGAADEIEPLDEQDETPARLSRLQKFAEKINNSLLAHRTRSTNDFIDVMDKAGPEGMKTIFRDCKFTVGEVASVCGLSNSIVSHLGGGNYGRMKDGKTQLTPQRQEAVGRWRQLWREALIETLDHPPEAWQEAYQQCYADPVKLGRVFRVPSGIIRRLFSGDIDLGPVSEMFRQGAKEGIFDLNSRMRGRAYQIALKSPAKVATGILRPFLAYGGLDANGDCADRRAERKGSEAMQVTHNTQVNVFAGHQMPSLADIMGARAMLIEGVGGEVRGGGTGGDADSGDVVAPEGREGNLGVSAREAYSEIGGLGREQAVVAVRAEQGAGAKPENQDPGRTELPDLLLECFV